MMQIGKADAHGESVMLCVFACAIFAVVVGKCCCVVVASVRSFVCCGAVYCSCAPRGLLI